MESSWYSRFKNIGKNIYTELEQGSGLRKESDFGLGQRSRLKMDTTEENILCILIILLSP